MPREQFGDVARSGIAPIALTILLLAITVCGCSEHRISFAQFLEMQSNQERPVEEKPQEPPLTRADIDRILGPYRIGPGDVLAVTVIGAEGVTLFPLLQARVDRNGEIDLPLVGATKVGDLELQDVERTIHNRFVPSIAREGTVHVDLITADTTNVLVVGAVSTPGLVPLRRTQRNLLFAIVGAGGVSDMASGNATLRRIRNPGEKILVNLTDPDSLTSALALPPLEQGDMVYVEAAEPNMVFVGGLVNRPAPQEFPPGTGRNILQAIAAAGGLRTDVTPREGTLIRRMPDGKDVSVKLSLGRIETGKDPNIALAAGDILWVPETIGTKIQDWVNRNVYLRAGASVNYNVSGVEYLNRNSQQNGQGSNNLQDSYDPFGFFNRAAAIQSLQQQTGGRP